MLKGYEGMKARAGKIPAAGQVRLPEAMQRLIQPYDETNRPEEAAKYRAELAAWFSGQFQKDNAWSLLWGWPRF